MGKKGNWLSTIKRVLMPNSKEKVVHSSEKRGEKEKTKWGVGKLRHGDTNSLIPLHREPSSIEKILGDAEREHQKAHSLTSREHQSRHALPSGEKQQIRRLPSRVHRHKAAAAYHPSTTRNFHHIAAIRIQTAYRGYMARSNFRALKGLMRLQEVVTGQSIKRQTMNAMRSMQLLVKIQSHIETRRIQMMENHSLQRQNLLNRDKEEESNLGKWMSTQLDERDYKEEWDDSMLTKEEIDAKMQSKVLAAIRRERALAYAYPHQLWKTTPNSADNALMELQTGGSHFPWWWNWLDGRIPVQSPAELTSHATNDATPQQSIQAKFGLENIDIATPISSNMSPITRAMHSQAMYDATPHRSSTQAKFGHESIDIATPISSNMSPFTRAMHFHAMNDATPHRRSTQAKFGLQSIDIATPISSNMSPINRAMHSHAMNRSTQAKFGLERIDIATPMSWNMSPITNSIYSPAKMTPRKSTQSKFGLENIDFAAPRWSNSSPVTKAKHSPLSTARTPQHDTATPSRRIKSKVRGAESPFHGPLKDDDSLISCPSFSVPSYMSPTVSAKAKVRAQSNPKERQMESKKRFSFHLPQSIGSLKWNRGSLFSGNHKPMHDFGNLSMDSSLSLPTGVGRQTYK